jgi:2-polyprenyl-3-methyl-5-hydroxy-6-metoxy-1,4-benzoquinol methylase
MKQRMEITIDSKTIDQINQRCYDNCYILWDRFPFPDILPEIIKKHYDPKLGDKVLDIGSGTGHLAEWLKKQGFAVECLDPSLKMVQVCQSKGLDCQQLTIQNYTKKDIFAIIFAILSLVHVAKKELPDQLNKISSLLPSNGLFILALIEGNGEEIEEAASGFPRFFAKYKKEQIEHLIEKDFEVVDYRYVGGYISYFIFTLKKR